MNNYFWTAGQFIAAVFNVQAVHELREELFCTAVHLKMARIDFAERAVTCYNRTSPNVPQI